MSDNEAAVTLNASETDGNSESASNQQVDQSTKSTAEQKEEELKEDIEEEKKYDSEDFETESESEVPKDVKESKTDEEKTGEENIGNQDNTESLQTDTEKLTEISSESKTDDEKKNEGEHVDSTDLEKNDQETKQEMSEADETKTETVTADREDEVNDQEGEITNTEDSAVSKEEQKETEEIKDNTPDETKDSTVEDSKGDEEQNNEEANVEKETEPLVIPVSSGAALEKEEYEAKIRENEELSLKLESALSNQQAERDAYKKLTEENAKLQKHHDDMKAKFDEMNGTHVVLAAEIETLRDVNKKQQQTIGRLEADIRMLEETQGGDERIRDMQEKLIRLSNDLDKKDQQIHSLEGELDATREKLRDTESRGGGNNTVKNSKTCVVM